MALKLPERAPAKWPHFTSTLRSTTLTARLGRVLGICFGICFVTGMLSHYQYYPWGWLPEPAAPVWLYRVTQGVHVATGTATIPLLLVKLWSVYPNLFRWPPVKSATHGLERASVAVLVSSALVQVFTGFFNALNWYPWPWDFQSVHRFLAYVVIGSILLHIAIKLPDIKYGLKADLVKADVLTEVPWQDNPVSHSNAGEQDAPPTPGLSRRGLLAATGAGIGVVVVTSVGQTLTPLRSVNLLAIRDPDQGPLGVPVNRTVAQAQVAKSLAAARKGIWTLHVGGPRPYMLSMAEIEAMATDEASYPISCVEGWSVGADWRGVRLLDVVERAGGNADSRIRVTSLEQVGSYNVSYVDGPQVSHALLATHLNGVRLPDEHGYPLRLIAPDRAGVLNTKWLTKVEVLVMTRARIVIGTAGVALGLFGVFRILTEVPLSDVVVLGMWLVGALVIHDGLLSPVIVGAGAAISRVVPPRARRYVQAGLIMGALVTVIALPMIYREDTLPPVKAILRQDYAANLTLLLSIIAVVSLGLYAARVVRDQSRTSATNARPDDDQDSPTA